MSVRLVLCNILGFYRYILFARVIVSFAFLFAPDWRPPGFIKSIIDVIYGLTEPPLQFIRRFVPQPSGLPLDLSFIVLYVLLQVLLRIVCTGGS